MESYKKRQRNQQRFLSQLLRGIDEDFLTGLSFMGRIVSERKKGIMPLEKFGIPAGRLAVMHPVAHSPKKTSFGNSSAGKESTKDWCVCSVASSLANPTTSTRTARQNRSMKAGNRKIVAIPDSTRLSEAGWFFMSFSFDEWCRGRTDSRKL